MAKLESETQWTEMVNKVKEMELELKLKEKAIEKHEADINQLKEKSEENYGQVKTEVKQTKSQEEVFTWEIANMGARTTTVNVTSPLYSLHSFPIGFKVKLVRGAQSRPAAQPNQGFFLGANRVVRPSVVEVPDKEFNLSLAFSVTDSEHALAQAALPFSPTVTYTVSDVTLNKHKKHIIRFVEKPFGSKINRYDQFSYNVALDWSLLQSPTYLGKDNKLTIKIGVSFENPKSKQDLVRWKVGHYWMKRFLFKNGLVNYHPVSCIRTHNKGYRVRIKQHFGDAFVIVVQFLTGEFDDQLKRMFPHVTTVVVENQWDLSQEKDLVRMFLKRENVAEYQLDIATHNELENGGYLVDDTLKLKLIMSAI